MVRTLGNDYILVRTKLGYLRNCISALEQGTAIEYYEGMITERLPCFGHLK